MVYNFIKIFITDGHLNTLKNTIMKKFTDACQFKVFILVTKSL